jgi:hypothetical protein
MKLEWSTTSFSSSLFFIAIRQQEKNEIKIFQPNLLSVRNQSNYNPRTFNLQSNWLTQTRQWSQTDLVELLDQFVNSDIC